MDLEETNKKLERQVELLTALVEMYEKYRDLLEECERYNKKYPTYYKDTTDPNEPYFWQPNRTLPDPIIY